MRSEPRDRQVGGIVYVLSSFTIRGRAHEEALDFSRVDTGVGAKFDGNLWKAVEWAEAEQKAGRPNSLDLDAPLQIP
jgi:hypothetical protein